MARITHTLTDTEIACGITLDQVAELLPKVLIRNNRVIVPADTPPALATSVARCAFGEPAVYTGHNELGLPVYRREITPTHPDYEGQTLAQNIEASARRLGL